MILRIPLAMIINFILIRPIEKLIKMIKKNSQQQVNNHKLLIYQEYIKQQSVQSQHQSIDQPTKKQVKGGTKDSPKQITKKKSKKQVVKDKVNRFPGITIAKAGRQINKPIKNISPGPTDYMHKQQLGKHSIKFRKASGHNLKFFSQTNTIGPGYYSKLHESLTKKKQFTIGTKYQSIFDLKKSIPGPGHYQFLPQLKFKSKSTLIDKGFGTSSRFVVINKYKQIPGPACYQIPTNSVTTTSINQKTTLSNAERYSSQNKQISPGPGQYNYQSQFQAGSKSIKGKTFGLRMNKQQSLPDLTFQAYNKYTIVRQFQKPNIGASYTIGHQKRDFLQIAATPSPQDYKYQINSLHSPSVNFTQARSIEKSQKFNIPGPGTYQKSKNETSIKYTFSKSKSYCSLKNQIPSPGVGLYNISKYKITDKSKGLLFRKQKKMINHPTNSVGVGDYNIASNLYRIQSITISNS